MTKGPKVEGHIEHLRIEGRAMWPEFREQAWNHMRLKGQWGPDPLGVALWVLLRNVPLGARRKHIIRGLALGGSKKAQILCLARGRGQQHNSKVNCPSLALCMYCDY